MKQTGNYPNEPNDQQFVVFIVRLTRSSGRNFACDAIKHWLSFEARKTESKLHDSWLPLNFECTLVTVSSVSKVPWAAEMVLCRAENSKGHQSRWKGGPRATFWIPKSAKGKGKWNCRRAVALEANKKHSARSTKKLDSLNQTPNEIGLFALLMQDANSKGTEWFDTPRQCLATWMEGKNGREALWGELC